LSEKLPHESSTEFAVELETHPGTRVFEPKISVT